MFNNMKIGARLTMAFSVVLLITLSISILSYARMGLMNHNTDKIVVDLYPKSEMARNIINKVNLMSTGIRNTLLFVDTEMINTEIGQIHDTQKVTNELIAKLESETDTGQGKNLIGKIKERRQQFDLSMDKLIELSNSDGAAATTYLINELRPINVAYLSAINDLIAYQGELMKQGGEASRASYDESRNFLIVLTALAAMLSAVLGWWIIRSILRNLHRAVEVATAVSEGDLTRQIDISSQDEVGDLLKALKVMNTSLGSIVGEVRTTTDSINTASQEIAQGNADLSQRTEEQASSLEETASSMEELTSTVRQNAENAKQANQLAVNASDIAVKGGLVVGEVVNTMASISTSSKKIVDIISVIEGIAFQTNILALNAAVEAARAGEQGRGFAVVASEVRNLAQRSAAASKEIKTLIGDSVDKVDAGSKQVDQAGATMNEIVQAVKRVTDIMAEIAAASNEQSSGIEQVNQALIQMDEVTQQNAALVEEAAAAAESMRTQAEGLAHAVSVFTLEAGKDTSRVAAKPAQRAIGRQAATPHVAAVPFKKGRHLADKTRLSGNDEQLKDGTWSEF